MVGLSLMRSRRAFADLRHFSIRKAAEAHARSCEGKSRRDMLLLAMHHASGQDRARLLTEASLV